MRCLLLRLFIVLAVTAPSARAECRLALAMAMDVSRSIDASDFVIQTEGLALALEDAAVQRAILKGGGSVALAVYQWSGISHQEILQDWVLVEEPEALDRVIWAIRAARQPELRRLTALGEAMRFGVEMLDRAPPCERRVLDVAGDGQNNEGISVATLRNRVDFSGVTVNGLVIGEHEQGLVRYFKDNVISGPGAFVEIAPRQIDFPAAIRRKLLRELSGPEIGGLRVVPQPRG